MTYDKAVANLLEAAGDYKTTVANHNLEIAMHIGMRKTAREKMRQAIESLSLGNIHLTLDETDSLSVTVDGWDFRDNCVKDSFHKLMRDEKPTTEEFKKLIEHLLVDILSYASDMHALNIENTLRFAGYAKLLLMNIDDDIVKTIGESYITYIMSGSECRIKNSNFQGYYNYVSISLGKLSRAWCKEKLVFTPGMKIGVTNLRTGKSVVRTIKRCKTTDGNFSIALNGSSSVITDPARIDVYITWYLNTDEYSDIARVIKWKPIADLI